MEETVWRSTTLEAFPNEHNCDDTSLELQKTSGSRLTCWDNV